MYQPGKIISHQHFQNRRRSPTWNQAVVFKISQVILLTLLLFWIWQKCHDPVFWPVSHVKVISDLPRVTKETLRGVISPFLVNGWVSTNVSYLKESLSQLPWVASVRIKRIWPNTLEIRFSTKQAIAKLDNQAYLDHEGRIFDPGSIKPSTTLPLFKGPASQYPQMLTLYQEMQNELTPLSLPIQCLELTPQYAWKLTVGDDLDLFLGRSDPLIRLKHFKILYPHEIRPKLKNIRYIDLRYTGGAAICFKKTAPSRIKNSLKPIV